MKPPKRIVVLSSAEYGLAFNGMLHFRNKLIQQGRYTDAVDELLIKLQKLMTVLSCPKCGILKQGVPEDLDEFAEEILDEM